MIWGFMNLWYFFWRVIGKLKWNNVIIGVIFLIYKIKIMYYYFDIIEQKWLILNCRKWKIVRKKKKKVYYLVFRDGVV